MRRLRLFVSLQMADPVVQVVDGNEENVRLSGRRGGEVILSEKVQADQRDFRTLIAEAR